MYFCACTVLPIVLLLPRSFKISLANYEMSGLAHKDTEQNSKTTSTIQGWFISFSVTKSLSSFATSQSLSRFIVFYMLDEVDTLNYRGVSVMSPVPAPTSSYTFHENTFCEIEFYQWLMKYINAVQYKAHLTSLFHLLTTDQPLMEIAMLKEMWQLITVLQPWTVSNWLLYHLI